MINRDKGITNIRHTSDDVIFYIRQIRLYMGSLEKTTRYQQYIRNELSYLIYRFVKYF